MWVLSECWRERSSGCCVLSVPDQGKCAVCSPPQAVAQVMIQSFQLSSCALFNAQMQDVSAPSPHPAPYLSISGPYLDVCDVTWQDSLWWFSTCKHGQHWDFFFSFLSVVITVFVQWFFLPLLLSIFLPPVHKCYTSSLCILYGIYLVLHRLLETRLNLGCTAVWQLLMNSVWIHVCLCQPI